MGGNQHLDRRDDGSWGYRAWRKRKDLKLSQAQVVDIIREKFPQASITQQTISKVEKNEVVPRFETMEILAGAYRAPVEDLFPWHARPRKAAS